MDAPGSDQKQRGLEESCKSLIVSTQRENLEEDIPYICVQTLLPLAFSYSLECAFSYCFLCSAYIRELWKALPSFYMHLTDCCIFLLGFFFRTAERLQSGGSGNG